MKKERKALADNQMLISILASVVSIAAGLIFGYLLLLILNPSKAGIGMSAMLTTGFSSMDQFGKVLYQSAPLMLCGLSVGFAFKTGMFNIGATGQYTIGAFCALVGAIALQLPWWVCLILSFIGGAVWGVFPGLFKALFNVNEVIPSIMFNWIGMYLVNLLLANMPIMLASAWGASNSDRTAALAQANPAGMIPKGGLDRLFGNSSWINISVFVAIIAAIICWFILEKTTFGYELKACGFNKEAARYAGINANRNIVSSMIIAGALSGLGGGLYYLAGTIQYVLEKKTAATLSGKASRARMLIEDKSVRYPLAFFCVIVSVFVMIMYIAVPFGALFKLWGRDYSLSTKWFAQMFREGGWKAFQDSFILSLIASPVTALLSMIISYLVVKRKFRGKAFIEFVSMLAMAVPGTVLGVGYIRGFAGGVFRTGFLQGIYGSGLILVIVFVVRSLPVGTRSGISALRQIDKSIEESAYDLGAGSGKVFTSVTLPLIKDSFFSGLVTTFVRSITAISAVILLVTPRYLLITCRINEYAEKGEFGVACAYATVLILITYAAILIMNAVIRRFGTSRTMQEAN